MRICSMGRFLLNALSACGGDSWTAVRMSSSNVYMKSVEDASVPGDIKALAHFLPKEMNEWSVARDQNRRLNQAASGIYPDYKIL